jgi:hypothetical protein
MVPNTMGDQEHPIVGQGAAAVNHVWHIAAVPFFSRRQQRHGRPAEHFCEIGLVEQHGAHVSGDTDSDRSFGDYKRSPNHCYDLENWSGRRDSNPRPQPWQGCALPLSYARSGATPPNSSGGVRSRLLAWACGIGKPRRRGVLESRWGLAPAPHRPHKGERTKGASVATLGMSAADREAIG